MQLLQHQPALSEAVVSAAGCVPPHDQHTLPLASRPVHLSDAGQQPPAQISSSQLPNCVQLPVGLVMLPPHCCPAAKTAAQLPAGTCRTVGMACTVGKAAGSADAPGCAATAAVMGCSAVPVGRKATPARQHQHSVITHPVNQQTSPTALSCCRGNVKS